MFDRIQARRRRPLASLGIPALLACGLLAVIALRPARSEAAPTSAAESHESVAALPALPQAEAAKQALDAAGSLETPALLRARLNAESKKADAQQADVKAKSLGEQLESLEKSIDVEQGLLDVAREEAARAHREFAELTADLHAQRGQDPAGFEAFADKVKQAEQRFSVTQTSLQSIQKKLDGMRDRYARLQQDRISALHDADAKQQEAADAQQEYKALENIFTLDTVLKWIEVHGLKLLAILLGTLALYLLVKSSEKHLVKVLAAAGGRGSMIERENRAITLVSVFRNVATISVFVGGGMMLLQEVGIPITPLMGGAAVFGLAVAFGAQNLIKDYFTGFMLLLEDQYGINDVVKIGDIAGAVEQITLRVTSLRDLEGTLHFIPHGTISTVSNMTHGWSRALLDIGVAYKEDTDRVSDELLDIAKELRSDAKFGDFITGDAELLGVDALGDSAVVIKMCIKTQPVKKWAVKREMLRRIKHRFDEVGIEIPFPHRTVFLHQENGDAEENASPDNGAT